MTATYPCKLKHFGREVFEDGSDIDGGFGADAHLALSVGLEETLDTTAWELRRGWVSMS